MEGSRRCDETTTIMRNAKCASALKSGPTRSGCLARLKSGPTLSGCMADSWTITAAEQGIRLDRFLAAGERLGSRGRAVAALERGKVFLNDEEVGPMQGGVSLG